MHSDLDLIKMQNKCANYRSNKKEVKYGTNLVRHLSKHHPRLLLPTVSVKLFVSFFLKVLSTVRFHNLL